MPSTSQPPSSADNNSARASFLNQNRKALLLAVLLGALALIVFYPSTHNGFINYDDPIYVTENYVVQRGLTAEGVTWSLHATAASNWHPLTWVSHMADCQMFGLKPAGHHFISVLLHAINTLLVFLVFRYLTGSMWSSLALAILFGLHPLRVESVAWASERKDILSTLFWLLTMLAYGRYVELAGGLKQKRAIAYGSALFLFALGLMSKPMLVTLPCVLLLLDYWPLKRFAEPWLAVNSGPTGVNCRRCTWRWLVLEKIPFFALAAGASIVTYIVQRETGAMAATLPLGARVQNAIVSYARYLGKTFWPMDLAVLYPHPDYWPGALALGCAAVVIAISIFAFWQRRQRPYVLVGWLWYLGTLVPVIGLVQVGQQSIADRYMYVPGIGLLVMIVWGLYEAAKQQKTVVKILAGFAAVATAVCVMLARQQIKYWKDSEQLFTHALAVTKDNAVAHGSLARALIEQNRIDEAIAHYRSALQLKPNDSIANNGLGNLLAQKGQITGAIEQFQEAIRRRPDDPVAYNNLGMMLGRQGKMDEAIGYFQQAVKIQPSYAEAHHNLGLLLAAKNQLDDAIQHYHEAIRYKPDYAKAYKNLGLALGQKGLLDEAILNLQQAVRLKPDYAEAQNLLSQALAQRNRTGVTVPLPK